MELPLGATEDRVVGSIDLAAALTGGGERFRPGLVAAADGGVLYVDEINLLPDHLVDVLLDVAASGINRVEREGVSHVHASRFLLVGSMNPEEGDLRPQLLDRFGLAVGVRTARDPAERAAAVRRRLAFDADPVGALAAGEVAAAEADLRRRLGQARPARVSDEVIEQVSSLCAAMGAEGLRADLTICRAAAALAAWEGRDAASPADVRRVAPLALAHRARRDPMQPAEMDEPRLQQALDEYVGGEEPKPGAPGEPGARGETDAGETEAGETDAGETDAGEPDAGAPDAGGTGAGRRIRRPSIRQSIPTLDSGAGRCPLWAEARGVPRPPLRSAIGRRQSPVGAGWWATGPRMGRWRRWPSPPPSAGRPSAPGPAQPAAGWWPSGRDDLREAVRAHRTASVIVLAVDASGSMGAPQRMEAAKGAVLGLLTDAYQRRDLVGLVTFRGEEAQVLLRPTGSVEVARARLAAMPTGGRTPLAAGIITALGLVTSPARAASHRPVLVLVTDGRATFAASGADPVGAAASAADAVRRAGVDAVVIDVESAGAGPSGAAARAPVLGLARDLAARMGGQHVPLPGVTPEGLRQVLRRQAMPG